MKNVEILNDRKQLLKRYRELPLDNRSLTDACMSFGPGKYYCTYVKQQNLKAGKSGERRAKKTISIPIYVYDEDYPEEVRQQFTQNQSKQLTVITPGARSGLVTPEMIREIVQEAQRPLLERIEAQDAELDDIDEEEDEEEDENSVWVKFLAIAQKPEYAHLLGAFLSNVPDEQKFAAVDAAFAADPTLKHRLFTDALSLLPKGFV